MHFLINNISYDSLVLHPGHEIKHVTLLLFAVNENDNQDKDGLCSTERIQLAHLQADVK